MEPNKDLLIAYPAIKPFENNLSSEQAPSVWHIQKDSEEKIMEISQDISINKTPPQEICNAYMTECMPIDRNKVLENIQQRREQQSQNSQENDDGVSLSRN